MIERFTIDERHEAQRERVRDFCEREVDPRVDELEAAGEFPEALVRRLGEEDFVGVPYPTDVGGADRDFRSFAITVEELARSWKLLAGAVNIACGLVGYPLATFGDDRKREEWLGNVCSGDWIPAFALTEPEAGSDAAALETTARLEGDEWVIDGHKWWTTHGAVADLLLIVARTSDPADKQGADPTDGAADDGATDDAAGGGARHDGISIIGVPRPHERDGIEVVRNIPCMEGDVAVESELRFDGLRVPADNLVGEAGRGFRYIMEGLDIGRLGTAAQGVGIAQGAFAASRDFADDREQFGQPIREFQGVSFSLADMAARTEAARLLTLAAADRRDRGERITQDAAMAKTFATDAAMEIATDAVQVHGARGYSTDYPVERYMREAKGTQIYDGTNEINRLVVANRLYE
ncbi:acyl-CoA dehydrogenase [Halovivax ruber XH-70]|uniref:Acyl-CoA dehydrogenase n=1 Tax=Halovivax ruber (strain DSM 18193 / JCM 13892 / XH-70) TaxID=797302 RepID=L0IFU1_HALRX|nr:acyl-CoA dehydrogenase family protein [Halovivax ruber]AGB17101.1 acyl-CoA dehydrogenase [Halovivax ruber XH-70]